MTRLMKYKSVAPQDINPYLESDDWTAEQKIDGMRIALTVCRADRTIHVVGASKSTAISDEVAAIRALGEDFYDLGTDVFLVGEVLDGVWWVFDIHHVALDGRTYVTGDSTWAERRQMLDRMNLESPDIDVRVVPVARTTQEKVALWERVVAEGCEGVILKHTGSAADFESRRTDTVLKVKLTKTADVVVTERGPGNGKNGRGNWVKFAVHTDGGLVEIGRCSTIGKPMCSPGDVIEVRYLYAGAGGRLVQPRHVRNRPDREPGSCHIDQLEYVNKAVLV